MKDIAEIRKCKGGDFAYMIHVIDVRTGYYYNSCTKYFHTLEDAKEYAGESGLTISIK